VVTRPDSVCAGLLSSTLVVPYALLNSRNRAHTRKAHRKSSISMKEKKIRHNTARSKVEDCLRRPSRQSTPSTPARSRRTSPDPVSTHGQGPPNGPATSVRPSELAITPTPSATPDPGAHGLEVPASSPYSRSEDNADIAAGPSEPLSFNFRLASTNSFETLRVAMDADTNLFAPLQLALADLIKTGRSFHVCSHTLTLL